MPEYPLHAGRGWNPHLLPYNPSGSRVVGRREQAVGAWGAGLFENDSALDWAVELAERGGIEPVAEALARATASTEGYLDADDGSMALAAAEAVAASKGAPADDLPAEVEAWAEANAAGIGAAQVAASLAAVERMGGTDSELADLWEESGSAGEWREHLERLRTRLQG